MRAALLSPRYKNLLAEGEAAAADLVRALPGHKHLALAADVAASASLIALRDAVSQKFGRLHILVNAAGFTKPVPHGDLEALDDLRRGRFQGAAVLVP